MNGMERPEERRGMEGPMHPVLSEIGDEHQRHYLDDKRERTNRGAYRIDTRPVEEDERRCQGENRQNLDEERVDEKVCEVNGPLGAKHLLVGAERKQTFQRDKHR